LTPNAAFAGNLDLLAPLGTVVSFSVLGGLMPDADLYGELRKRLGKSLGVRVYSIHTLDHERELRRGLMERAIELMAAGCLRTAPAHRAAARGSGESSRHDGGGTQLGEDCFGAIGAMYQEGSNHAECD
jgi:hypothetical protein